MLRGMFLSLRRASSWTMISPGLGLRAREEVRGVLHEQRIDVDDVALDQQVVRALTQFHECPRDDVDEPPREFAEGRAVALAGQLPRDARGDFRDAAEAPHRVVARAQVGPAQVEHIELAFASGAARLHVHALEQVRVALGVEDDHHFVPTVGRAAADVLRDEQFGQARLADARGAQHQGMPDPLPSGRGDIHLLRLDAVQARQPADRRQGPHGVHRMVPRRPARQARERWRRELQALLAPPREPVERGRLDVAAELGPVGLHQPVRVALVPAKAAAEEQALLADRDVAAGHHVARQAADVASVAQDGVGLLQADAAEGRETEGAGKPQSGAQRERPRCHHARQRGAGANRNGV